MARNVAETRAQTGVTPVKRELSLRARQARLAWIMMIPTLAIVVFIALYPLAQTVYYSFTNQQFLSGIEPTKVVGFQNYNDLLHDSQWWTSVWVTIKFTFLTCIFEFALGIIVALVVNSNFKGRGAMRAAMLVPWAIPTVISAQMWNWMYNDIYGVVNDFLVRLHIISSNIAWVSKPATSIPAIAAVDIWKTTPFVALLLLAGLQVIPTDIYEAADVDGATKIQQFFRITLPLLRPAIMVTLVFRTLDALRVFDVFYVMFGSRQDTQTMAIYNQNTIVSAGDVGYGSTISIGVFLVIAVFVVIYVTFLRVEES